MQEHGRPLPAEEAREPDLTARRREEVGAADDEVYSLLPVVHRDRELVGPMAAKIANQQVAALVGRILLLNTKPRIIETLRAGVHPDPPADSAGQRKMPGATAPRVAQFGSTVLVRIGHDGARTVAAVDEAHRSQPFRGITIDMVVVALPSVTVSASKCTDREEVGVKAEPVEIVENAGFEFAPRADPIVILDSKEHSAADRTGDAPDVAGIQDVPKVQPPGGRWRKSRERRRRQPRSKRGKINLVDRR